MELGLEGRVIIVTGGASGIGRAIVNGFVKERANVVIADIDGDVAQKFAESVSGGYSGKVLVASTDVTKERDANKLVSVAMSNFRKIDVLVNDAGVGPNLTKLADLEGAGWERVIDVNLKGVYLVTKAVLPYMLAVRYGKIINISSFCGKEGVAEASAYCASKFAVIGVTQSLAKGGGGV